MSLKFIALDDSRCEESFAVLDSVARWIQQQGRRQRISKISLPTYRQWQSEGANYVVTENDQIVGLVTLRNELLKDWPNFLSLGTVPMLRALATHPDHRGKGVGGFAIGEAAKLCYPRTAIYLDCVSEFLPNYYAQYGFVAIAEQRRNYPDDELYDITLMQKKT
jgi:GNAT superfamily N-acetyltransferase